VLFLSGIKLLQDDQFIHHRVMKITGIIHLVNKPHPKNKFPVVLVKGLKKIGYGKFIL